MYVMPTHKDKDIYRNKYKNSTGSFWHSKTLNKSSQLFVLDSVILQKVHALSFSSFLQKKNDYERNTSVSIYSE